MGGGAREHPGDVGGGGTGREGHVAEHQITGAAGLGAVLFLSPRGRSPGAVSLLCSPVQLLYFAERWVSKQLFSDVTKGINDLSIPVALSRKLS